MKYIKKYNESAESFTHKNNKYFFEANDLVSHLIQELKDYGATIHLKYNVNGKGSHVYFTQKEVNDKFHLINNAFIFISFKNNNYENKELVKVINRIKQNLTSYGYIVELIKFRLVTDDNISFKLTIKQPKSKILNENLDIDKDQLYTVIYENLILGIFTSDLKAKEAIKQHIDSVISSYKIKDIESIDDYKEELSKNAIINTFLVDRLYNNKQIK